MYCLLKSLTQESIVEHRFCTWLQVVKLIEAVEDLKRQCDVPATIKEIFNDPAKDAEYLQRVET